MFRRKRRRRDLLQDPVGDLQAKLELPLDNSIRTLGASLSPLPVDANTLKRVPRADRPGDKVGPQSRSLPSPDNDLRSTTPGCPGTSLGVAQLL